MLPDDYKGLDDDWTPGDYRNLDGALRMYDDPYNDTCGDYNSVNIFGVPR